jgi:hypothetical protein
MSFCTKCGKENRNEAQFCQNCGNAIQSGHSTHGSEHSTHSATSNDNMPAIWNPKAAVWWSLPFSPLGQILHYLNWKTLGKGEEAKQAIKVIILFCVLEIISFFIIPEDTHIGVSICFYIGYFGFWLLWGWIRNPLGIGKEQIEYVAEKYGTQYKRKSWFVPLAISFAILCGIIFLNSLNDFSQGGSQCSSILIQRGISEAERNYDVEQEGYGIDPKLKKMFLAGHIAEGMNKNLVNLLWGPPNKELNNGLTWEYIDCKTGEVITRLKWVEVNNPGADWTNASKLVKIEGDPYGGSPPPAEFKDEYAAGNPSALVGKWKLVYDDDNDIYSAMELLSDGNGIFYDGDASFVITWKMENGRIYVTASGETSASVYKLQGSQLKFTADDGKVLVYAKEK